jgi:hypothetical protein
MKDINLQEYRNCFHKDCHAGSVKSLKGNIYTLVCFVMKTGKLWFITDDRFIRAKSSFNPEIDKVTAEQMGWHNNPKPLHIENLNM